VSLAHFVCAYRLRVAVTLPADARRHGGVHVSTVDGGECGLQGGAAGAQQLFPSHPQGAAKGVKARSLAPGSGPCPETALGALLVAGSITIFATNFLTGVLEADLFGTILLIQSLPFLSAVALVWLERRSEDRSAKLAVARPTSVD